MGRGQARGRVVGVWRERWRRRRRGRGLGAVEVVRAQVVLVCVLLLEGGGASRWRPRPDVSVSESKTAELIVGQQLRVDRVWSLEATGRRGVEHVQGGLPAAPIGRLTGGQIYQSENLSGHSSHSSDSVSRTRPV